MANYFLLESGTDNLLLDSSSGDILELGGGVVSLAAAINVNTNVIADIETPFVVEVGVVNMGTATSGLDIDLVNFKGSIPKAAIFFGSHNPSSDGIAVTLFSHIGFATTSQKASFACSEVNGLGYTQTVRSHRNDAVIHQHDVTSGVFTYAADVSFTTDKITLSRPTSWNNNLVNYIAFGGSDIEAEILFIQTPTDGTGTEIYAHSLSGKPDLLLVASIAITTDYPAVSDDGELIFGVWSRFNNAHWAQAISLNDNIGISDGYSYSSSNHLFMALSISSIATPTQSAYVESVDDSNITLNFDVNDNNARRVAILAIKGVQSTVGNSTMPSSGNKVLDSPGYPKLFTLFAHSGNTALETVNTANDAKFGIGSTDGTNQGASAVSDHYDDETISALRVQRSDLSLVVLFANVQTIQAAATFSGDTLTFTTNPASAMYFGYVHMGAIYKGPFSAAITGNASVTANLIAGATKQLVSDITATTIIVANVKGGTTKLSTTIVGTASVAANIKPIINFSASISSTVFATAKLLGEYPGNTIQWVQTISLAGSIYTRELVDNLNLASNINVWGTFGYLTSNSLTLTQSVVVDKVLPVRITDSALVLTDTAEGFRATENTLFLTDEATGVIFFLTGVTSNTLVLIQTATVELIVELFPENVLFLIQEVDLDQDLERSVSSNIDFHQHAYGVALSAKKYVLLQAPFYAIQTSIALPNPLFDDTESLVSNINLRRSMNGKTYTYVKKSINKVLKYTFTLPRMKALELQEFCRYYNSVDIKLLNWKGEVWNVKIMTNPIDFVQTTRYDPTSDRTDVNLEFEGIKVYG